jgi:molecular chaperone GrpE (heat shock protein)
MKPVASAPDLQNKKQEDSYFGWAIETDASAGLDTLMTNEPLTKELNELTEEVSAIRHFAAQQQDQMRKLQDGYDWMIIRRFCLRIIRCIDNIDDRVSRVQAEGGDVGRYLEDIRDELVFALEASGIEQFGPDLNTSFKGLEKYAEAVRERVFTEDAELIGCIAEVARPGYQYLVNDDDVKIVRCAQVKLYESKEP